MKWGWYVLGWYVLDWCAVLLMFAMKHQKQSLNIFSHMRLNYWPPHPISRGTRMRSGAMVVLFHGPTFS